ncbi:MAG TPA: hypothetical protein VFA70_07070 [Dehalococcoidia bacterium]|nr:hypothetical protein [Dehalococcoidia bacterium]
MAATTRVALIGGASLNWSPTFLGDLFSTAELDGSSLVLIDIDAPALELMGVFAARLQAAAGSSWRVETTTDRRAGLRGAEVVAITLTVGGFETMAVDLALPARYGIAQSVGDTVGPGGLARALRNIPVLAAIGSDVADICPGAVVLNYTNPLSVLTRTLALTAPGVTVVGLCHELPGVMGRLRRLFGLAPEAPYRARLAGVNHFTWLLDFQLGGRDGYRMLDSYLAEHPQRLPYEGDLPGTPSSVFEDRLALKLWLYRTHGLLPAAGDRHLAEFLPGILSPTLGRGAVFGIELTTIEHRRAARARRRAWVEAVAIGAETPEPARSQEKLAEFTLALAEGREATHVLNLPNQGQAANLPREAVVETMGVIGPGGAHPIASGDLPPAVRALVLPHVLRQELTVEAGLRGDRRLALEALASDPLIANPLDAAPLLDELLAAHAAYLPQF